MPTPLVFSDLTAEELYFFSDSTGCGNKEIDVPDWVFLPACKRHDFDYWVGGPQGERAVADKRFLKNMLAIASEKSFWRRMQYKFLAYVYYSAVRIYSNKYFWYGEPRGREELDVALVAWRAESDGTATV